MINKRASNTRFTTQRKSGMSKPKEAGSMKEISGSEAYVILPEEAPETQTLRRTDTDAGAGPGSSGKIEKIFQLDEAGLLTGIILSEVLGKPKAKRRAGGGYWSSRY